MRSTQKKMDINNQPFRSKGTATTSWYILGQYLTWRTCLLLNKVKFVSKQRPLNGTSQFYALCMHGDLIFFQRPSIYQPALAMDLSIGHPLSHRGEIKMGFYNPFPWCRSVLTIHQPEPVASVFLFMSGLVLELGKPPFPFQKNSSFCLWIQFLEPVCTFQCFPPNGAILSQIKAAFFCSSFCS